MARQWENRITNLVVGALAAVLLGVVISFAFQMTRPDPRQVDVSTQLSSPGAG